MAYRRCRVWRETVTSKPTKIVSSWSTRWAYLGWLMVTVKMERRWAHSWIHGYQVFILCRKIQDSVENFRKLLPVGIYTPRLIKEAFTKAFRQTNNDLWNANFDCTLAGSTLVVLWLVPLSSGVKLYCANVGDSRAVMGRKGDRGWSAIELSHD